MTGTDRRRQLAVRALWLLTTFGAAAAAAAASAGAPVFYHALARPAWAPPAWVFGLVWSVLYTLMGLAAGWVATLPAEPRRRRPALGFFVVQLSVNALWSWLFFAWHHGGWALGWILLLELLLVATIRRFHALSPAAAWMLAPCAVWVAFAAALNWSVWRLNPALLAGG